MTGLQDVGRHRRPASYGFPTGLLPPLAGQSWCGLQGLQGLLLQQQQLLLRYLLLAAEVLPTVLTKTVLQTLPSVQARLP